MCSTSSACWPGPRLELNTLGDAESRLAYRGALVAFLRRHGDALSPESRARLESNPLRVLDSKREADRAVLADAPTIFEYLTPEAAAFFEAVLDGLEDPGHRPPGPILGSSEASTTIAIRRSSF